jgi:restriction system protein
MDLVVKREGFSDEQQALMHRGAKDEIAYRLAWARTALKTQGLLTNSSKGVWTLTDAGVALLNDPLITGEQRRERVDQLWAAYRAGLREARRGGKASDEPDEADSEEPSQEANWKEKLLVYLMGMQPDAFERLARRLLREADFDSVMVTGRSGDGGIDGMGVYRLGLVSFPVFFQCKRYQGSVGSSAVRDFRGAMASRGDKGLLITTGTFTAETKRGD